MKNRSALLVIDAQKIYTDPTSGLYCPDSRVTVTKINKLVKLFERKKLPIFFIRHMHKKNGSDLGRMFDFSGVVPKDFDFKENSAEVEYTEKLYFPKEFVEIRKNRYSSFIGTSLEAKLKKEKVNRVVITGFMTNFCCESAARDAHDRDYFVDFILDATGTPGAETMNEKQVRKAVGEFLSMGFARVSSARNFAKKF